MNATQQPVVVTGATGFVGRRLVHFLLRTGHVVHGITRHPEKAGLWGNSNLIWHEIPRTAKTAVEVFEGIRPKHVYHLAAMFRANHSTVEMDELIEANVCYGARLAEALQATGGGVFVSAGTIWQCVNSEPYFPACLYAALKQAQEDILQHYSVNGAVRVVNVRVADAYGPDDPRPRLLSLLKRAALSGASDVELTGGDQLIDMVHVDDVVQGLVQSVDAGDALQAGHKSLLFSVSGGRPLKVKQLVAIIESILGRSLAVRFGAKPYRQREMFQPWIAGAPPPGWQPLVALEDGLRNMMLHDKW